MTLRDVVLAIEDAALASPQVRTIVRGDVYRLNSLQSVKYGAVAWLQGQHSADIEAGRTVYAFTLFYVDRLTTLADGRVEDASNELEVQSTGIAVLTDICRRLQDHSPALHLDGEPQFTTFTQRFSDECAGAYVALRIVGVNGYTCPQPTEEPTAAGSFNSSFNNSFL